MKKSTLIKLSIALTFIFAIAIVITIFCSGLVDGEGESATVYRTADLIFGIKKTYVLTVLGIDYDASLAINFSLPLFIAFFLPIIISTLLLAVEFTYNNKIVKIVLGILAFASFIVSLIFIIKIRDYCTATLSSDNEGVSAAIKLTFGSSPHTYNFATKFNYGLGLIFSIVFTGLGIVSTAIYSVLNLIKANK